jgi:hypothetical protein
LRGLPQFLRKSSNIRVPILGVRLLRCWRRRTRGEQMSEEKEGLVNRALARATGANVHDVRLLGIYYRNACVYYSRERQARVKEDIVRYERVLGHFADTGQWLEGARRW